MIRLFIHDSFHSCQTNTWSAISLDRASQGQADVADLVDYLHTLNLEDTRAETSTAHLVTRTDLPKPPLKAALLVDVLTTGVTVDGRRIPPGELPSRLADAAMKRMSSPQFKPGDDGSAVLLAIDDVIPWSTVAEVVEAATAAGLNHIGFVFRLPSTSKPPPHMTLDHDIEVLSDPSEKATVLAKIFTDLAAKSKPLQKMFAGLASFGSGNKADMFVAGAGEALLACDCNVDMDIFIVASREGQQLALPGATPWYDASKQITGSLNWLVVK